MSDITITVERIEAIEPHSNADRLEIAKVAGTQCVVPKDKYHVGQFVVYFPPDVLIPADVSKSLGVDKYLKYAIFNGQKIACRVAACRLRGTPSYGFVTPIASHGDWTWTDCRAGTDVTHRFRATKYEPPVRAYGGLLTREPANFHRYTDIQHYRKYHTAFAEGMPVRVTEKIHGCVTFKTTITMVDGSKRKIGLVQVGDTVLGVRDGQVVPARVLNIFNNGRTDCWFKVTFERKMAGRGGNALGSVRCTPNHEFWSPITCNYVRADQLRVGDSVSLLRTDRKPLLVPQRVVAIEAYHTTKADRYDIETETHNYFANGVLTHNSNSRVGLLKVDDEWQFVGGSHATARKQIDPEGRPSLYWEPLQRADVLQMLTDLCNVNDVPAHDVILFGELYGPGIQDLDYGIVAGSVGWRLFDISVDGTYLNWADVEEWCHDYGVETVPLLYKGPFSPDLVEQLTYGPTTVAAEVVSKFKGREGIVITPLHEQSCHIGRLILKSVSADYLDRKGAQDDGDLC